MKQFILKRRLIMLILLIVFTLTVGISYGLGDSNTNVPLKVEENTDLTYYLEIEYDGRDRNLISSSNNASINMYSDIIYVEDTLPNGLIFKNFVRSENDSIGAVNKTDGSKCSGYVVDGINGMSYDPQTRKVSFRIRDLKAGCKLTVGIVTTTPKFADLGVDRLDFYNTAYATENNVTNQSQTLHSYMQNANAQLYNVSYSYTGDVPTDAPSIAQTQYSSGTEVGIERNPSVYGYTFSGWSTTDATVNNGVFTMPSKNVTFTGSFTKIPDYKVTYKIDGDMPDNYIVPIENKYYANDIVSIDSTAKNTEYGEYIFNGWTAPSDINVSHNKFTMPNKDVVITGSFTKKTYKVTYKFDGNYIPKNASALLPAVKSYSKGDKVTLENIESSSVCIYGNSNAEKKCKFLGWDSKKEFIMPNEDVVIVGKWDSDYNVFTPSIEKEIIEEKKIYSEGEIISFAITVHNNDNVTLTNVKLREQLKGVKFISGNGYDVVDDETAVISEITPYGSVKVYAEFIAGNQLYKKYTNKVIIMGAQGNNDSALNTDKKYVAEVSFIVSNIISTPDTYKLNITKVDEKDNEITGAEFTLYSDSNLNNRISSGLSFNKLQANHIYYLKETKYPEGYEESNKVYEVVVDKDGSISIENLTVTNKDGSATVRISNKKKEEPEINPNTEEKTVIKKEEPKKNYIPYILGTVVPAGLFFLIIIILFRRKRTIMLYIPNIDVENDTYFIKNRLSEIDYDSTKKHKVRVIILSNNKYYQYKDNKVTRLDGSNSQNKNDIFVDFINYVLKKQKAKKYDLCILDNIISTQELLNVLDNSNISGIVKLETILLRYNTNISEVESSMFGKYTNYIGYTKEGYKEFEVNNFLYTINLINKNDDGDKIKELIVNEYNKSIGSIQEIGDSNYVVIKTISSKGVAYGTY